MMYSILLALLASPRVASAATKLVNPLGYTSISAGIKGIIQILLGLLGSAALVMFIYGGISWILSRGSDKEITRGKDTIFWAVMGMIVVFGSYVALQLVFGILTK